MKIKLEISPATKTIITPDSDLEGMLPNEKEDYIEQWMKDEAEYILDYEWKERK